MNKAELVEAMAAISLVDMIFVGMTSKMEDIIGFFNRWEQNNRY